MSSGKPLSKMHQRLNQAAEERKPLTNVHWDEAEQFYQSDRLGIQQTHGELAAFLQTIVDNPELISTIEDLKGLITNINLLSRDIQEHTRLMDEIHDTHKGRAGGTTGPDDNMLVLQVHGRYSEALEIYNTNVMPTVAHILEQCGAMADVVRAHLEKKALEEAQAQALKDEQAAADLLDTSVVSDVQVKEVKGE